MQNTILLSENSTVEASSMHDYQHRLRAIDLFSGCGGLSQGLKDAGFEVCAAVEIDRKAQITYQLNHPEVCLYESDIRLLDPELMMQELNLARGQLDLLAGCPPCQGFSRLRNKNKNVAVDDARNNLVLDFLRFVEALEPKSIMLENVPGLSRDDRFLQLRVRLEQIGYKVVVGVLDAADYQVPQRRKRLILLASIVHDPEIAKPCSVRMTVRQALANIEAPSRSRDKLHSLPERRSTAVVNLIAKIPKNGGSRSDLGVEAQLNCHKKTSGFFDVYGRMAWDEVAPTITSGCHNPSKGRFLHPSYNRTITLREAAVLQGFPSTYRFLTSHGKESIALMIGNALPPPFIKAHALALKEGIMLSEKNRVI
ncbi:DNA cytosine methyltransferase [Halopseudomonas sp.]|jgi:DNA (cytosine-5)-methyltransferase 1|uniref:DNA cytosine methyltransferase n=1 Tax=Halopseudomonas sp. TaxID=2901191 RepID=UPI0039E726F3